MNKHQLLAELQQIKAKVLQTDDLDRAARMQLYKDLSDGELKLIAAILPSDETKDEKEKMQLYGGRYA